MFKALAWPCLLAASAVREFPRVAAVMPEKPASIEQKAPVTKAMDVFHEMPHPNKRNTTAIKTTKTEYSFFKKAMAPLWIIPSNSCMSGEPLGCFLIYR